MAQHISTKGLSHEEWLAARQKGIGSSDVSAILGLSKYKSKLQVYEEKVAAAPVNRGDTKATLRGKRLEPFVAEWWMEETGRKCKVDAKIRRHPFLDWMCASVDRVIQANDDGWGTGILEIKTALSYVVNSEGWEDGVPLAYYTQVQHQLFVTGYKWAVIAVYIVDRDELRQFRVEKDDEYLKKQNAVLTDFWEGHVLKRVPPEMSVSDAETKNPEGRSVEASAKALVAFNDLLVLEQKQDDLKAAIDAAKDAIKADMIVVGEDGQSVTVDTLTIGGKVIATWKGGGSTFDSATFKANHPDLYDKYQKPSGRRFIIKRGK